MDERTVEFNTNCNDCLFAQFTGNKQTGCKQNRLSKYIEQGLTTKIVEDDKSYYHINTICNAFCQDEKLVNMIPKIIRVQCDLIVSSYEQVFDPTQDIINTIKSAVSNKEKPNKIFIVVKNNIIKFRSLMSELKSICGDIPFNLIQSLDNTYEKSIDYAVNSVKSTYYTVLEAGDKPYPDFINRLNIALNTDLKRFVMVEGDHDVYSTKLHKLFHGNDNMPLRQKIKEAAEFQKQENMITTWDKL